MTELLSPAFWRRLHALRQRLSRSLRRFELSLESPTGKAVSPEVDSLRPYAPGDDPRTIDWGIFARTDRYFVKSVVREEEGLVHILVDVSRSLWSPYPEKLNLALELAAGFGYLMLCAGNRVVVSRWSDRLLTASEPVRGEGQAVRLLQEIGRAAAAPGETNLDFTLANLLKLRNGSRCAALVLSDFLDVSAYERKVNYLRSRDVDVSAVQILHPAEARLKLHGNLELEDPETGRRVELLVGRSQLRSLRRAVEEHRRKVEGIFAAPSSRFQRALTGTPFEDPIVRFFRTGAAAA